MDNMQKYRSRANLVLYRKHFDEIQVIISSHYQNHET